MILPHHLELPRALVQELASLFELYEALTRQHWSVDPDAVHAVVRDRLDDLRRFVAELDAFWH